MNSEHDRHDRVLIARFAAGDAYASEQDHAQHLVDNCTECSSLAADIRLISARTSELPALQRPRDFRISADQVASLRGSWLDRLMRTLQGPGWSVVRPLAGAALAIGLVFVVIGALPLNNLSSRTASDAVPGAPVSAASAGTQFGALSSTTAGDAGTSSGNVVVPEAGATPEPQPYGSGAGGYDMNATDQPSDSAQGPVSAAASAASAPTFPGPPKEMAPTTPPHPQPTQAPQVALIPSPAASRVPAPQALVPAGSVAVSVDSTNALNQAALIVGGSLLIALALIVLIVVWVARRRYSDPLVR